MRLRLDVELDNNETRHCAIEVKSATASITAYSVRSGNPLTFNNIESIENLNILSEADLAVYLQRYIQQFVAKALEPAPITL